MNTHLQDIEEEFEYWKANREQLNWNPKPTSQFSLFSGKRIQNTLKVLCDTKERQDGDESLTQLTIEDVCSLSKYA